MFFEVLRAVAAGVWIAGVSAQSGPSEQALRTLSLDDAAAMLEIEPHTLLAWEARYGFPTSSPSEPRYSRSEVLALRDGLRDGVSVASAVAQARTRTRRRRVTTTAHLGDRRGGGLAS